MLLLMDNRFDLTKPAQNPNEEISSLLEEWNDIKVDLEECYNKRDQAKTLINMKKGIELFQHLMFLTNEKPIILIEHIEWNLLEYKPVNITERFAFIKSRPNLFHSFRQLSELMVEQEKQFMKKNSMKKASKPNG